ncbi:MAG: AraC family transcriptional regulator [Deltaproteobacteria bacterium]|nr:AraC family transcriptional regulator [Deltaproteobacteria bacterium]
MVSPEEVAREAAFSKYHFHRIFLAITGNSVAGYIRRRRLTEAAHALTETDNKIIEVALDFRFETPESFSRAFKNMFGVNPRRYRNRLDYFEALHQPKIDPAILTHLNERMRMEVKILTKEAFKIMGMGYFGENKNKEITQLWDAFLPRMESIKNRINPAVSYGICYPVEGKDNDASFEYIAAVEVSDLHDLPAEMVGRTIPTQKYAVFTHQGSVDKIPETYQAIYAVWQPKSGYELTKAPDFEYYDERFNPDHPEASELDIYIPIK